MVISIYIQVNYTFKMQCILKCLILDITFDCLFLAITLTHNADLLKQGNQKISYIVSSLKLWLRSNNLFQKHQIRRNLLFLKQMKHQQKAGHLIETSVVKCAECWDEAFRSEKMPPCLQLREQGELRRACMCFVLFFTWLLSWQCFGELLML